MNAGARGRRWLAAFIAVLATTALTGCREEEQDRVLLFEQGTYLGTPDEGLSEEQVDTLHGRAMRQQY